MVSLDARPQILWTVLALTLAGVLGAFGVSQMAPVDLKQTPQRLATYGPVPSFKLVNQAGRPFESASMKGRVWIVDFIFTSCAGTCPQMTQRMARLQRKLPSEIEFVSISVDPARDTPPVLAKYAKQYGAQEDRWHFLTGDVRTIAPLVQEGFRLSIAEGKSPEEPIIHSIRFVLVDRQGRLRGYYDSTEPVILEELVRDAKLLLTHP